jgi:hypothetical protein
VRKRIDFGNGTLDDRVHVSQRLLPLILPARLRLIP